MNVYVIYKFSDTQKVNELLEEYKKRDEGHLLNFFNLMPKAQIICGIAKQNARCKAANLVVYFADSTERQR